jgi:O-antigen/teichoic acid export membrane protein
MLTSVLVSRMLGPSQRGVYFMVITVNYMIINIGSAGAFVANPYMLAKNKYSLSEINANSMIMALGLGCIGLLVYLFFRQPLHRYVLSGVDPIYTLLGILLVPFAFYAQLWSSMMIGLNRIRRLNKFNIANSIIGVTLTFAILVVFKQGLYGLMVLWMVTSIGGVLVMLYLVSRETELRISFQPNLFRDVLLFGVKGHIGSIAGIVFTRLDTFIVNALVGVTGVGYYSLSRSLAEKVYIVSNAVMTAANPRITGASRDEAKRLVTQSTRHLMLIGFTIFLGGLLAGPWLIRLLYGSMYIPSITPFLILLPGIILLGNIVVVDHYFTGQLGRPEIVSALTFNPLVINLLLSLVLTAKIGIIGAALALTISCIAGFGLDLVVFRIKSGCSFRDTLILYPTDLKIYFTLLLSLKARMRRLLSFDT